MALVEVDPTLEDRDRAVADRPEPELPGVPGHRRRREARQLGVGDLERLARTGAFPCDRDRVAEPRAENDAGHGLEVRALPDRPDDLLFDAVPRRRDGGSGHETSAAFSRWITSTGVGSTPLRIAT